MNNQGEPTRAEVVHAARKMPRRDLLNVVRVIDAAYEREDVANWIEPSLRHGSNYPGDRLLEYLRTRGETSKLEEILCR